MAATKTGVDIAAAMITHPTAAADWLLVAPVLLCMVGGATTLILRKNVRIQPLVGISLLALLVLTNLGLFAHVWQNGVVTMVMGQWLPPFGIAFTADALGVTLALIASIVGLLAGIYAAGSIAASERRYGFYPFLFMLLCGVSGAFLTGDIFNLYVWFEVLLISSFGLLVLGNTTLQIDGALKYALLNLIGTTLFLIATGLLYGLLGTLNMADIALKSRALGDSGPLLGISALYFLAFAMKAAAFPVNFWLPASYHTPRIVVSALFAGLLTKVGVYALLRVLVLLLPAGHNWMHGLITVVAIVTMLTGVLGALAQADVRRTIGYLVISGIGSMLAGIAVGSEVALTGAIMYAVHSILAMTALFLIFGITGKDRGTFNLRELGGMYRRAPLLSAATLILLFAAVGLPPFSGFWPKVLLVDGALAAGQGWLAGTILLASILTAITVGRIWIFAFWRGGPEGIADGTQGVETGPEAMPLQVPFTAWLPLAVLIAMIFWLGLQPEGLMQLAETGAHTLLDPTAYVQSVFGVTP
ncbi:Na+/H+ antiporter subunit D [Polycladidibacter hongkongensis]|uniref:Na+/H+ antiporter subunit D n=1 Tax=Polycladidibacter hongkongensis TaxID=1647556 RepID=UPI0008344814|nr:Na+/H+ antiporter subunit D [Pseudovibrio hongkongensis]